MFFEKLIKRQALCFEMRRICDFCFGGNQIDCISVLYAVASIKHRHNLGRIVLVNLLGKLNDRLPQQRLGSRVFAHIAGFRPRQFIDFLLEPFGISDGVVQLVKLRVSIHPDAEGLDTFTAVPLPPPGLGLQHGRLALWALAS